ncbi:MAG: leucyl aminopeptidase, partial [Bacteroidetes bacterium]
MTIQFASELLTQTTLTLIPIVQEGDQAAAQALQAVARSYHQELSSLQSVFTANKGELYYQHTAQGDFLLVGLGTEPGFAQTLKIFRQLVLKQPRYLRSQWQVSFLHQNLPSDLETSVEAITNGLGQGRYQIGKYKTVSKDEKTTFPELLRFGLAAPEASSLSRAAQRAWEIAEVQCRIMDLVNAPSNKKTPQQLAAWAQDSAKTHGYQVEVWDKDQIAAAGMGGLLAVNQGSPTPPAFIILEYKGPKAPEHKVGLVGKGVTFDTGGLSIKPATNMHYMKSDMGGA